MERIDTLAPPQKIVPPDLDAIRAERGRRSLAYYYEKIMWPQIEPGRTFLSNWHIDYMCEVLSAVTAGDLTRVIINMPPRYGKTGVVSLAWPTWTWISKPQARWLFVSYSGDLATEHNVNGRNRGPSMESPVCGQHVLKLHDAARIAEMKAELAALLPTPPAQTGEGE